MAKYRWTHGTNTRTMPIGSIDTHLMNLSYATPYNVVYEDVTYTIYKGSFYYGVAPYLSAGYFFDSKEDIHDETWNSGALTITVNGYGYGTGYQTMQMYNVGAIGSTPISLGKGWGFETGNFMGIMALAGQLNGTDGIFFFIGESNWSGGDRDLEYQEFIFFPNDIWELSDVIMPYAPDGDTEAGDPDEKGGFANGFPVGNTAATSENKGIVFPFGSGVHCYVITPAQLNEFSRYMWGSAAGVFDEGGLWGKFQNYKFNPIAGILSCHSLPLVLMPAGSGSASISIAGTTLATATGSPCGSQFTSWVSQTVQIPEPWGSFVDYAYATISIYLPFCGIVPIDVSAVIGGSLYVRYYCDVINGNVSAWIVGTDRNGISQLLKTATGNAAYHIPITGNDNGQGEIIGSIKQAVSSGISGNVGGLITAGVNIISGAEQHHTESVGSMNGNVGYCASTEVFLICNWPFPIYTQNFDSVRGRPSEVSGTVGSFSGYNEFEVHADSISGATEEEKQEIESLLQSGVFV